MKKYKYILSRIKIVALIILCLSFVVKMGIIKQIGEIFHGIFYKPFNLPLPTSFFLSHLYTKTKLFDIIPHENSHF
ncbi:MAG: hypothetical protein M1326_10130 [Cyanobacteria bacterium]|nr:hypothetical protein [Cyanobacteriota bacterium]